MNIIFLDVDGVLNSDNNTIKMYYETKRDDAYFGYEVPFDETCLSNLKVLIDKTNSKIVVSSNWWLPGCENDIHMQKLLEALKRYNLDKEVIGGTPISFSKERYYEIKYFLDNLGYDANFVILDDDSDMLDYMPFLVKINREIGLTIQDVEKGIDILNKQKTKISNRSFQD